MFDQIRQYLAAHPFQEFALNMADGRQLVVKSPDWIWITPKGGLFYWHQENNTVERLNALLLLGVRGPAQATG